MLLGGRTAEEVALGEVSTGAQNDLQRATDIARAMVTEYGMSPEMGLVSYDNSRRRALFLELPGGNERGPYAEDTAQRIDGGGPADHRRGPRDGARAARRRTATTSRR